MNILFNPIYRLKPDDGRVLIIHSGGLQPIENQHSEEFSGFIHPLHAIILSFINGSEYSETIKKIRGYIDIDEELIKCFINRLIDCEHAQGFSYGDTVLSFPAKTIINSNKRREVVYDNPEIFFFEKLDLRQKRHKTVSSLTLMLNNKCATNVSIRRSTCPPGPRLPITAAAGSLLLCSMLYFFQLKGSNFE